MKDKASLASRAKKSSYANPAAKPRRVRSEYLQFVKSKMSSVKGSSPQERLKKIAQLWAAKK